MMGGVGLEKEFTLLFIKRISTIYAWKTKFSCWNCAYQVGVYIARLKYTILV